MKPITLSKHAEGYFERRGFTTDDVVEAIRNETWIAVTDTRWECRRDFPFSDEWNGRWYATRQVRPIFVDEPDSIVVVTVYTCYF